MSAESLIHIIYASAESRSLSQDDLDLILRQSRRNNARLGITGILLYAEGSFFQVLGGAPEAVDTLYKTIAADPRHCKVTQIIREPIARRVFQDWTMGYSSLTKAELRNIDGLNDFFDAATCFTELDPGRAKRLLNAFIAGRWHERVVHPLPNAA